MEELWTSIAGRVGYDVAVAECIPGNQGVTFQLVDRAGQSKRVTLLPGGTVFTFPTVSRLIRGGINTVIGITGHPTFTTHDLDSFFTRATRPDGLDELVLISGSSKDYEYQRAIELLQRLMTLQVDRAGQDEEQLAWFGEMYQHALSFMPPDDDGGLTTLLSNAITPASWHAFKTLHRSLVEKIGVADAPLEEAVHGLASFLRREIRHSITIQKEIRQDSGSIYHVTVHGKQKRLVLVADGFVVNFFAKYEKGVKTEYMDPIMTMQVLALIKLAGAAPGLAPGLYCTTDHLVRKDMDILWQALNERTQPLLVP